MKKIILCISIIIITSIKSYAITQDQWDGIVEMKTSVDSISKNLDTMLFELDSDIRREHIINPMCNYLLGYVRLRIIQWIFVFSPIIESIDDINKKYKNGKSERKIAISALKKIFDDNRSAQKDFHIELLNENYRIMKTFELIKGKTSDENISKIYMLHETFMGFSSGCDRTLERVENFLKDSEFAITK